MKSEPADIDNLTAELAQCTIERHQHELQAQELSAREAQLVQQIEAVNRRNTAPVATAVAAESPSSVRAVRPSTTVSASPVHGTQIRTTHFYWEFVPVRLDEVQVGDQVRIRNNITHGTGSADNDRNATVTKVGHNFVYFTTQGGFRTKRLPGNLWKHSF